MHSHFLSLIDNAPAFFTHFIDAYEQQEKPCALCKQRLQDATKKSF